ncbi:MAG: hypothetical protein BZ138_07375 [Methanosphaera sp. rholeuAM270]|nr:MAG: hypothetical protein BZ138_07375 [Methanosphaera sp. rholeuAM270]
MTVYYPDTIMQRYTLDQTSTGVYGEPVKEYVYTDDITVDLQIERNNEIREQYGVEKQNLYTIHADINTSLESTDQLELHGERYYILGEVKEYDKFHHYKKAHLIKER